MKSNEYYTNKKRGMKMFNQWKIAGAVLAFVLPLTTWAVEDREDDKHPNYDLHTIRPNERAKDRNGNNISVYGNNGEDFAAPVVGMDWLNDDRDAILINTWRGDSGPQQGDLTNDQARGTNGRVFAIHNIRSNNRSEITAELIADGFKDAHGVKVVDGEIYVSDINALYRLVDNNNDGFYETKDKIGDIPAYNGWFEYTFGLVYSQEKFWIALASHVKLSGDPNTALGPDRGVVISMDMNGNYDVVCSGLRAPNGIITNPDGELFVTDNQGGYRPSSMFINVKQGRNYGYRNQGTAFQTEFMNQPVSPPAVWAVHGPIANGPTGPAYMPSGTFKGQYFAGDIGKGGIKRYFIEKVNGEYQGAIFPFSGAMEVGIDRILIDEDGTLFAGGVGNGGQTNQGWDGTRHGLQRMDRNNTATVFEILAVRSREGGMELEFTTPVGQSGGQAGMYSGVRYQMRMDTDTYTGYGSGNRVNSTNLNITGVQVSEDRTRVFLEISNLQPGWVVEIDISESLRDENNQQPWFHSAWYTLNNISSSQPFEIPGCTDPTFEEYNPDANVDDGSCQTSGISAELLPVEDWFTLAGHNHIRLHLPLQGQFQVDLVALDGSRIRSLHNLSGGNHQFSTEGVETGLYLLKLTREDHTRTAKIFIR